VVRLLLELLCHILSVLKIDFTSEYPIEDMEELESQIKSQLEGVF
jgi:hypothetical protein